MSVKPCSVELDAMGRETEARGTPLFPCGAYEMNINCSGPREIPWHWHDDMEMLIVHEGSLSIMLSDTSFTLGQGEGAFINSKAMHSASQVNCEKCTLRSLVFDSQIVSGSTGSVFERRYIKPLTLCGHLKGISLKKNVTWQREALSCIALAFEAYAQAGYGHEFPVRDSLSRVCYLIVTNLRQYLEQDDHKSDAEVGRIKAMLNFIHANYASPIELKHIAEVANVSERECLRCFKELIGLSPVQYLIKYRLMESSKLLLETDFPVVEISNMCGFDSPSYFSKVFKRFYTSTPSDYRKKLINIKRGYHKEDIIVSLLSQ